MVCLGNICRSPLAEGVLQTRINELNLDWTVDSAGTSGFHNGEMPDGRSVEVALNHGIDIRKQKSRILTSKDFDVYDHILVMDSENYKQAINLANSDHQRKKVSLLMNYAYPNENRAVPDPYYGGGFEFVFEMIEKGVDKFIENHINK